ncbi:MAG: outer membrane protein assembly factor BamD [Alphaproteobacteria bacterium]|nr:outer membrane protein assembly factor BamD [Alphaproteobacteria bacterium]
MNIYASILMILISGALLSGCAKDDTLYADKPVDELYSIAEQKLNEQDFTTAAEVYDEVDRQHPYSPLATKAQLLKGVAYYKEQKYPNALAAIETYIQLHPGHEDADYAHYLRAMCYYEQIFNVQRDQKIAEQTAKYLEEVITRFPASPYAREAKMKLDLTLDHLAGKEMTVGRFYLNKEGYAAAINRFRSVVSQYKTTSHVPEALHRLVECYTALGLQKEAKETAAVLGHNFPKSQWYKDTYSLVGETEPLTQEAPSASFFNRFFSTASTE